MMALTTLGQVGARRGRPEAAVALDEALQLAERTGQLLGLGPIRAARAEAALLVATASWRGEETLAVRDLVFARGNRWQQGQFAWLLWQAGDQDVPTDNLAEPYALQVAGGNCLAAPAWHDLGCPYEEACAWPRATIPLWCGARQPSSKLSGRGRRSNTLSVASRAASAPASALGENHRRQSVLDPHGLTRRELEVLRLLAAGHSNRQLGDLLFISPATAARHLANIFAKLGVDSRAQQPPMPINTG